jgi:hypothetical protein
MKKALVLSLAVVLGLGVASFAQTFDGSWSTDISFTIPGNVLTVDSLTSALEVNYNISGWTFGFNTLVGMAGLFDLYVDITGSMGAFTFSSFIDFDTAPAAFVDWENVVQVSIAGVDVYGAFALQMFDDATPAYGSGWAIGGHGVAGMVEVWAQANFNLSGGITHYFVWSHPETFYGFDYMTDWQTYFDCYSLTWAYGDWAVQTNSCVSTWSAFYFLAKAPLACMDLIINTSFTCAGWVGITFGLNNIDLGAGWFQLDDLNITFTPTSKTVSTDFTLTFGSWVCVKPYFDLNQVGLNVIEGITLRALTLSFEYNGVTLKAGELFAATNQIYTGFTKDGALTDTQCFVPNADEFVGIFYSSDACCGGALDASFVTFFDAGSQLTGIFDYVLMVAKVEVGIGSNFSVRTGMEISPAGIDALSLGFTLSW